MLRSPARTSFSARLLSLPARLLSLLIVAALGYSLCGCGLGDGDSPSSGEIRVVATTPQIADLVVNVAGERVELKRIMSPGSDPHIFEPRASDVAATADAALVFSNGNGLDDWAARLIEDGGSDAELVDLSATLPSTAQESAGHDHGDETHSHEGDDHSHVDGDGDHDHNGDPHWWHDPRNVLAAVAAIRAHLTEVDPARAREYRRNASRFSQRVRQLDRAIENCIEKIPPARRKLVTDHDAFGSFAARYGLEVIGAVIPAQSTQAQASAKDLSDLAETIRREGVPALFPSHSLNSKVAENIAAQTGATTDHVLYGDTLDGDSGGVDTYLEMMAANTRSITEGLSGGRVRCELEPAS